MGFLRATMARRDERTTSPSSLTLGRARESGARAPLKATAAVARRASRDVFSGKLAAARAHVLSPQLVARASSVSVCFITRRLFQRFSRASARASRYMAIDRR